eukprot:PhM_4_TR16175/c0_g1_i1/m.81457
MRRSYRANESNHDTFWEVPTPSSSANSSRTATPITSPLRTARRMTTAASSTSSRTTSPHTAVLPLGKSRVANYTNRNCVAQTDVFAPSGPEVYTAHGAKKHSSLSDKKNNSNNNP